MNFHSNSAGIEKIYSEIRESEKQVNPFLSNPDDMTLGEWRFLRMYRLVNPLLLTDSEASWLTVGDGRYGGDAQYLSRFRNGGVTATDLYPHLLAKAVEIGLIDQYLQLDAEKMNIPDSSYDYVLCKESYHHFQRPPVALYEMLRVSRKAVVLLEPNDLFCTDSILQIAFRKIISFFSKVAFRTSLPKDNYEPVGNYVYRISVRELEKVAICSDYPMIAYCQFPHLTSENSRKLPI